MKQSVADLFICPACLPDERKFKLDARETEGEEIVSGHLRCPHCHARYEIAEGIACLIPPLAPGNARASSRYERPEMVSSYLWSHFADLFADEDAGSAYADWAAMIGSSSGTALDAGCAVGRFALELSRKSDFVIGLDYSRSFIRAARKLLAHRRLDFTLVEEGKIHGKRTIVLPEDFQTGKVELIVGDAHALPFPAGLFSSVSSLNLIDKVAKPLQHIREMSRVARVERAQLLLSDPFSWSEEIASQADWLGGLDEGDFVGRGIDNIASILEGRRQELSVPWKMENKGSIWWKIRNHRNHFELIRSCFIKACR